MLKWLVGLAHVLVGLICGRVVQMPYACIFPVKSLSVAGVLSVAMISLLLLWCFGMLACNCILRCFPRHFYA